MGCWSLDRLPLAKFYDYVCSAVVLISLNSILNRRPAVISLNSLCPLVFERPFVVCRLLWLFPVGMPWITIQCAFISSALAKGDYLYMKAPAPPGYNNDWDNCLSVQRAHISLCTLLVNVILVNKSLAHKSLNHKSLDHKSLAHKSLAVHFVHHRSIHAHTVFCSPLAISFTMDFFPAKLARLQMVLPL